MSAKKNGVDVIELDNIDKEESHPTITGMTQIREQILEHIKSEQ